MDCREVTENLIALRDDELQEDCRAEIMKHLEECESCREEYRAINLFFESYNHLESLALSPDYMDKLLKQCGLTEIADQKPVENRFSAVKSFFALAAAIIILVAGYFVGFRVETESPYIELMKISRELKSSLNDATRIENIAVSGNSLNRIGFTNRNFQRIEFVVSRNSDTGHYELAEITDGKKDILFARMKPFQIEFSMKGRTRLDYNIVLKQESPESGDSIQYNSTVYLNNTQI